MFHPNARPQGMTRHQSWKWNGMQQNLLWLCFKFSCISITAYEKEDKSHVCVFIWSAEFKVRTLRLKSEL
jgi:hypothetical protein